LIVDCLPFWPAVNYAIKSRRVLLLYSEAGRKEGRALWHSIGSFRSEARKEACPDCHARRLLSVVARAGGRLFVRPFVRLFRIDTFSTVLYLLTG